MLQKYIIFLAKINLLIQFLYLLQKDKRQLNLIVNSTVI